jgi:serine protease Do
MSSSWLRKGVLCVAAVASAGALTWGIAGRPNGAIGQEAKVSASRPSGADNTSVSEAKSLSRAFRKAAEVAMPSTVTIRSKSKGHVARRATSGRNAVPKGANPFKGTPFEDFFNGQDLGQGADPGESRTPHREGMGSGVIIDKSGIVLTNNHVVAGADEVTVQLADGREFKGEEIKTDEQTDMAVVRIKGAGSLPVCTLGDSDSLEIGDWVLAIGNPFELEHTVSAGIISGKGRELGSVRRAQFLQTDAAINPGNSGGPLVNIDGEVVGINTAIATNSGSFAGIGFAIPINTAKWVANQLIKKGNVDRAYLGVAIGEVSRELADQFGVHRGEGVLVSEVFPNSPAAAAGFHEGDIVTKFGDKKVHSPRELQELVERVPLDTKEHVEVIRDGKTLTLSVAAKALPKEFGNTARGSSLAHEEADVPTFESSKLGIEVKEMTSEEADTMDYKGFSGVLISKVEPGSPAAEQGLREGMLVMKVGKKPVKTVAEFEAAVKGETPKDGVLLLVRTKGGNRFVVLRQS